MNLQPTATFDPQELTQDLKSFWRANFPRQLTVIGSQTREVMDFLQFISNERRAMQILQDAGVIEFQDGEGQFQIVRLFDLWEGV